MAKKHVRPLIELSGIGKTYAMGDSPVHALCDIDLSIARGTFSAIIGPSGSGKSTLMNIIGCLDRPTRGRYLLDGVNVAGMKPSELAHVRNRQIGFIFQNFNLLSRYNVFHNVELPLIYSGLSALERRERVLEAVARTGLTDRIRHRPSELSGGQRQRVAIARALVNRPSLILADEPTGNLDSVTGREILTIFRELVKAGNTIIIVTHDHAVAKSTQRRVVIADGRLSEAA
ncbi:MAG: ABC transporter ATP-binding protein [Spirochaetota bacterium]